MHLHHSASTPAVKTAANVIPVLAFLLMLSLLPASVRAAQQVPSAAEMWAIIQEQAREIEQLKQKLGKQAQTIEITEYKIEATADAVEQQLASDSASNKQVSIGGYGELHLNQLEDQRDGSDLDELDLHRFVLFFGHQFTDSLRFYSELEIEHSVAGEGKNGEVEVEQAFIQWDYADGQAAKAGVFLIPVGLLNETHEPDTFYGVERNRIEAEIIPATWWEGGLAFSGELAPGLSYDLALHSGLFLDNTARIRSGRQKVSEAPADSFAYTGRIRYSAIPGLELAATVQYQSDLFQGQEFSGASDVDALLFELHAAYEVGNLGLRALYAAWDIDEGINAVSARDDVDRRSGFYLEPSYRLNENLGLFVRYSEWDEVRAQVGFSMEMQEWMIGANWWLSPTTVIKLDLQDQDAAQGRAELDGFNLGVGWSF